uniref:Uncharacterized protein n=1 Tax=Micrurus corallinus TaxID=54390 RepID=A0A2D4F743_MICCO
MGFLLPAQRILSAEPEASVMVASINKLPLRSRFHPASPSAPLTPLPPQGGWGRALGKVPQGCWPLCEVSCLTNLCWEHSDASGNGCAVERGSLKRTLFLLNFEINTYENLAQVSLVSIQAPFTFHGLQMASVILAYSTGQRCHLSCELLPHETAAGKWCSLAIRWVL